MRMVIAAMLLFGAFLFVQMGDGGTAVILGALAIPVWIGMRRFLRLIAGIAMMLRAFSG